MKIRETGIEGCLLLEPSVFEDERGYFFESFNQQSFEEAVGEKVFFVQDNQSFSLRGVVRGIHYQRGQFAQGKLVRVLKGRVMDVIVDLRRDSLTFKKHYSIELSGENKKQLFIPRGFGHGFSVLSDTAEFFYKCDNFYNKSSEGGIIYNDITLNIDWGLPQLEIKVSAKDLVLPTIENALL